MEQNIITLIIIYAILEYIELSNQKGATLRELIYTNFTIYQDSNLKYFALHSTFFFLLYLCALSDFGNFWLLLALLLKGCDIGLKLYIIGRVQNEGETGVNSLIGQGDIPLESYMKILSGVMYISLVITALI